jgi:hypothetical protein
MWGRVPLAVDLDSTAPRARCDQVACLVGREDAVRNLAGEQRMCSRDPTWHGFRPRTSECALYRVLLSKYY